ncbi:MAG: biotin--[Clostridia bacterium]|nr:biotin--[acetyl-CoA-carboxylase] ligase [Clostridia bacterium]
MAFNIEKFEELTKNCPVEIECLFFDEIDSTNNFAKRRDVSCDGKMKVIVASSQSSGRGRLGKKFVSQKGKGIYFSVVTDLAESSKLPTLTVSAAVCVCRAMEKQIGKCLSFKWVNDIFLYGKKICGILTENVINPDTGAIEKTIIGIGADLYGTIDGSIKDVASTVEALTGKTVSCEELVFDTVVGLYEFLTKDDVSSYVEEYKRRCLTLKKRIIVNDYLQKYEAYALDIDEQCRLLIERNGKILALNSGEVSVLPL